MKYILVGAALSGNKGAAAMIEATINHIAEIDNDATFTLLTPLPEEDRKLTNAATVAVMSARPAQLALTMNFWAIAYRCLPSIRGLIRRHVPVINAIANAQAYLDLSGISFMDSRAKFILHNVVRALPPLVLGTPAIKLAQALGPFDKSLNRLAAKALLPRFAAIFSRGSETRRHLNSLRLTNTHDSADLAFTLDVTPDAIREAEAAVDKEFFAAGGVIGFSPSSVLEQQSSLRGDDYIAQTVAQIDYLTGLLGRKVLVIAHAARSESASRVNNDLPVCRRIVQLARHRQLIHFVDAELGPGAQRCLIGRCEIFIASRFHAMVSALASGIPPIVIGWSHKYREVLEMFGIAKQAVPHEGLTPDTFIQLVTTTLAEASETRARIVAALPLVRALAMRQFEIVKKLVSD